MGNPAYFGLFLLFVSPFERFGMQEGFLQEGIQDSCAASRSSPANSVSGVRSMTGDAEDGSASASPGSSFTSGRTSPSAFRMLEPDLFG